MVESNNNTVRDNLLSGQDTGARIEGDDNVVQGNHVGTDLDGEASIANLWGVIVSGGDNNLIGGTADGEGNLLSGNTHAGLRLQTAATSNDVQGNLVGTDVDGDDGLENGNNGVAIEASGFNTLSGNVISANGGDGVVIKEVGADNNVLEANLVGTELNGTDELGNGRNGVFIDGGNENRIGDPLSAAALNTIAFNDENGVAIDAGVANSVLRNSIHHNGDLGIDLESDGVTANDILDIDVGANNLQNSGAVTSAVAGAVTTVNWTLSSLLNTDFRLEFYANDSCDASGHGEGQVYLGTQIVTTGQFGGSLRSGRPRCPHHRGPGDLDDRDAHDGRGRSGHVRVLELRRGLVDPVGAPRAWGGAGCILWRWPSSAPTTARWPSSRSTTVT